MLVKGEGGDRRPQIMTLDMTMFFAGYGTNQKIIILSCDSRSYSLGIFAIQKIRGCFAWNELGVEVLLTHFAKNILLLP